MPGTGMLTGSASTSSLHAARAAATRSAALLETKIERYLVEYRLAQRTNDATVHIQAAWRGRKDRSDVSAVIDERRQHARRVRQ